MDTPYTTRFNLLSMAKDMLTEEYHMKRDRVLREWEQAIIVDSRTPYPELPTYPSDEKLIDLAAKLNKFVSKNRSHE